MFRIHLRQIYLEILSLNRFEIFNGEKTATETAQGRLFHGCNAGTIHVGHHCTQRNIVPTVHDVMSPPTYRAPLYTTYYNVHALNMHLNELVDAQTKDMSRMFYIPAQYENADNWIYESGTDDMDVDALMREHPYTVKTGNSFLDSLPDAIREQVIEHRMGQMDNTNVSWTSYHDCPFFPKRMATEYKMISSTGWYALMYKIMVATACNAVKNKYPITQNQMVEMCKQLDGETGGWYESRPLYTEAERALKFAYSNSYTGD